MSHVLKPSVVSAAGRGRGRGLSNLPAWMSRQNNGSNEQVSGVNENNGSNEQVSEDKKPSAGRRRGWGLNKKPWVDFGVRWGDNTIKGGGKDKKTGEILSDVLQSSVLSAAGRRRG